jgi:hypothetical protein
MKGNQSVKFLMSVATMVFAGSASAANCTIYGMTVVMPVCPAATPAPPGTFPKPAIPKLVREGYFVMPVSTGYTAQAIGQVNSVSAPTMLGQGAITGNGFAKIPTALTPVKGYDSTSGISWGIWRNTTPSNKAAAIYNPLTSFIAPSSATGQYVTAPKFAGTLPTSGTVNFRYVGGTALSSTGTVGSIAPGASFSANFTAKTAKLTFKTTGTGIPAINVVADAAPNMIGLKSYFAYQGPAIPFNAADIKCTPACNKNPGNTLIMGQFSGATRAANQFGAVFSYNLVPSTGTTKVGGVLAFKK